ncbi:hypothetical protein E9229_001567 [Paeniglutamicibacter cryotolerans]|uniref:Uncharacterized protein n=1 Tax=Paeniglutamicibacter cryotolerans TaxID=670079 RepID=A0A839QN04_9MICC|nr:hypothetical protein [Paeniglutamicibacter cryotolerans]MBB2995030.1 hypothetical protein [Paeniglutamicibacter cryotolerans]MBB2995370.1 hypothetical protein [Paeniglutamicibacter cryotolerans]MBB2995376.1 hypothetical protein [Paeniglutamicibacter cryotolerans]
MTTNRSNQKDTNLYRENQRNHTRGAVQGLLSSKKLLFCMLHDPLTPPPEEAGDQRYVAYKMLASTMQFPNNNPITPTTSTTTPSRDDSARLRPCAGTTRNKQPTHTTTHPPPQR